MILGVLGLVLILVTLGDAFSTIVLPKTVSRGIRPTQLFDAAWRTVSHGIARRLRADRMESFLGIVWPLSTIVSIGLWAVKLVVGFALIQAGLGTPVTGDSQTFATDLYMSAATFFTLGYGDVTALSGLGRTVSMVEAGVGFAFLALVIGYVPVFYQAFSARERTALLLDARAGAPPMAGELLRFQGNDLTGLRELFAEYERWAASLLEGFLSFPVLAFYRSQHAQLSWLACLTCITDACAFVMAAYPERDDDERALKRQAAVTFAISRHLAVDLAFVLGMAPVHATTRLGPERYQALCRELESKGVELLPCEDTCPRLQALVEQYEPYFAGLGEHMLLQIPEWLPRDERLASWQTSAWADSGHF